MIVDAQPTQVCVGDRPVRIQVHQHISAVVDISLAGAAAGGAG
jgi:hypothetical protein